MRIARENHAMPKAEVIEGKIRLLRAGGSVPVQAGGATFATAMQSMFRFMPMKTLQKFAAAKAVDGVKTAVSRRNLFPTFNQPRLIRRGINRPKA